MPAKFHQSISDMLVENASYIPHSGFPIDVFTALRESKQVNLFFEVGFVQQGKLQICLSREEASKVMLDIFEVIKIPVPIELLSEIEKQRRQEEPAKPKSAYAISPMLQQIKSFYYREVLGVSPCDVEGTEYVYLACGHTTLVPLNFADRLVGDARFVACLDCDKNEPPASVPDPSTGHPPEPAATEGAKPGPEKPE
ncbi:MAG: hypothetical protein L0Y56_19095 [Nitrospira sp.]|nr:hypothetical protein [Nitrospira sp.]